VRSGSLLHVATLAAQLEDLLGVGRVSMRTQADIQGVRPRVEASPGDLEHLAAVLALANQEGLAVCVVGAGTKLAWGNPPARFDVLLRLDCLPTHCQVDADDLTMTVSAGTTVGEARAAAHTQGRVLPLDARLPARATVGGAVATADQGPRGAGYGSVRDVVLGLKATLADGSTVKFGGRTMKNVAGYDMTKLFVGSFGCLGVITEVTIRLLPRSDSEGVVLLPLASLDEGARLAASVLDSQLTPLALMCVGGGLAGAAGGAVAEMAASTAGGTVMAAGFTGPAAAVERSIGEVRARAERESARVVSGASEIDAFYDSVDFLGRVSLEQDAAPTRVVEARASVPISRVWALAAEIEVAERTRHASPMCRLDAARGVLDLRLDGDWAGDALGHLRGVATGLGGQLTVTAGSELLGSSGDAWGPPSPAVAVMRNIKARFDPRGTLNPGRFVGGV
jgi:glycolate oxidase FAD binding subunit